MTPANSGHEHGYRGNDISILFIYIKRKRKRVIEREKNNNNIHRINGRWPENSLKTGPPLFFMNIGFEIL